MNRIINSSLSKAIYNDDIEELRYLLNTGKRTYIKDNTGWTPLHCAVQKNRLDMVELILAQPDTPINIRTFEGETPLFLACLLKCDHRIVSALLIAEADPNISNNEQVTPLHVVHDLKSAELLLTFGANVNFQDFNKYTPLHSAVEKDYVALVDILLNAGADTSLRELNGLNPLMLTFQHNFSAIEKLINATKNLNATASDGWSALMLAINSGKISIAFNLLEKGADINIVAENFTPLHLAVMKQEEELFKYLWNKKNKMTLTNLQNLPHLMLIHRWYVPERIEYFLKVLEISELFSNEKNQRNFLEFFFRFERDNKLELVICDLFNRIASAIAPKQISPLLLICFIENFSGCRYKVKLLDILLKHNVADFDNKIFSILSIDLDPELVPKLLTLTLSVNPIHIFYLFTRKTRMDMAVLKLLVYLLNYCTPINKNRINCIEKLKRFNPYSAKRVKYTLRGVDAGSQIHTSKVIDYEITPEDREIMCDIYNKINDVISLNKPPSLKELSRDCIRNKMYSCQKSIKNCDVSLKNVGLPKDLIDIILLKRHVNSHYS